VRAFGPHAKSEIAQRQRLPRAVGMVLALMLLALASIRLFVLPARDAPRSADAVVVLGGAGNRLGTGVRLVREGYAPILVDSDKNPNCLVPRPRFRVICFSPQPATTQGEARRVAQLARQYRWRHLIVVTSTDQTTRARLRFERCTSVNIRYVTTPIRKRQWPYHIAYEWGALGKALLLQRSC